MNEKTGDAATDIGSRPPTSQFRSLSGALSRFLLRNSNQSQPRRPTAEVIQEALEEIEDFDSSPQGNKESKQ